MDSSGVHLLLEARRRCRKLLVMRGSPRVQRPLAALDLERELEFVDEPACVG